VRNGGKGPDDAPASERDRNRMKPEAGERATGPLPRQKALLLSKLALCVQRASSIAIRQAEIAGFNFELHDDYRKSVAIEGEAEAESAENRLPMRWAVKDSNLQP
jgi:hypothetical protein